MNRLELSELPVINGERVSLRPITEEDTELIVRWRNDPEVCRYFIFREPFTREMHTNWLRSRVAAGAVIQYIILAKNDPCSAENDLWPVGSVYFRDVDYRHESAEYGIFIGEAEARGRGLGSETARLFTDFGLDVLGLHRIALKVLGGNDIARRSYEKAGFRTEGVFRDMVKLDGEFADVIFMAKLNAQEES